MPLVLAIIALPLVEIALFIAVGARIGTGTTLLLILLSGLLGVLVLRGQKARLATMMQGNLRIEPGRALAEGAFRLVAGLLLVLPGFLTDALGLALLVPAVQRAVLRSLAARGRVASARVWQQGDIVEGDFHVQTPGQPPRPVHIRLPDRSGH